MRRSAAPSRRKSNNPRARHQRDREYRPDRRNTIVDDFAVMPRIPEERFRPHTRIDAYSYVNLSDPNRARPALYEYEVADLPDVPLDFSRPQTPPGGFNGYALGMRRCNDCRSWINPPMMQNHRCPHCHEADNQVNQANRVNQVNSQQNTINRE